jgi:N12 class adenine-specific DNA methylase
MDFQKPSTRRDYSRTYNEHFDGFVVRKFSGDRVKITGGEVRPL